MRDHKTIVPARVAGATALVPQPTPPSGGGSSGGRNAAMGILRRIQRATTRSLALVGVGTLAYIAYDYNSMKVVRQEDEYRADAAKDDKKKKRVLVLPFHRMRLVETKKKQFGDLARLSDDDDRILEVRANMQSSNHTNIHTCSL